VSVTPTVAGLVPDQAGYGLKNLWTGESTTATNNIAAQVAPHGVVLYRVKRL
jgi:hypothetical protein